MKYKIQQTKNPILRHKGLIILWQTDLLGIGITSSKKFKFIRIEFY